MTMFASSKKQVLTNVKVADDLYMILMMMFWYVDLAGKVGGEGGKGVPITATTPNHASTPSRVLVDVAMMMIETGILQNNHWQKSTGKNRVPNPTVLASPCHKSIF